MSCSTAFRSPTRGAANVDSSLLLIDDLELQIAGLTIELRRQGADHPYIPLLLSVPGICWVLAFTIASEIGDIERFAAPKKLVAACVRRSTSPASATAAAI